MIKGPAHGIGWAVKQMFNGASVRRKPWAERTDPPTFLRVQDGLIVSALSVCGGLASEDILATDWELAQNVAPPQSMG